jgi:hypothetical protein
MAMIQVWRSRSWMTRPSANGPSSLISTRAVYDFTGPDQHVGRDAGQWNSLEIDCRGTSYQVLHNGIAIVRADAQSFPDLAKRRLKGFLGLQNHSEQVWFRHVRIGPSLQAERKADAAADKAEPQP